MKLDLASDDKAQKVQHDLYCKDLRLISESISCVEFSGFVLTVDAVLPVAKESNFARMK